jgi:hypothetical protein
VVTILASRAIPVTDIERARILACIDLEQLDRWLVRAASASTTADVLAAS